MRLQTHCYSKFDMSYSTIPRDHAPLKVVIAVDVEEDGLFTGRYPRRNVSTGNVQALEKLRPLVDELGFPVTLLCAWPVLNDRHSSRVLRRLQQDASIEIGAHLHHWNTPPLESDIDPADPSPALVKNELMAAKLRILLEAAGELRGSRPVSFRMGRWDLRPNLWPLLAQAGFRVDSSVHPMRSLPQGPDHFMAPRQPFRLRIDTREILEMPICTVPLLPDLPILAHRLAERLGPTTGQALLAGFPLWGCLQLKPVFTGLRRLKLAASLLVRQGGSVLSLFWHSSEMKAGCTPHLPGEAHVDRVMARIRSFLIWLKRTYTVQGLTMESLGCQADSFPVLQRVHSGQAGDWCPRKLTM